MATEPDEANLPLRQYRRRFLTDTIPVATRVTPHELKILDAMGTLRQRSRSDLIREALVEYFQRKGYAVGEGGAARD